MAKEKVKVMERVKAKDLLSEMQWKGLEMMSGKDSVTAKQEKLVKHLH